MISINNNPVYTELPVLEFKGNPIIEALKPPPLDNREAILRLKLKPDFDVAERELPSIYRITFPPRLRNFVFPTAPYVKILKQFYVEVLHGYRKRNPRTVEGQRLLHNAGNLNSEKQINSPSQSTQSSSVSFITGLSGMGKSTLVKAIMRALGDPVIKHSNYKGEPFTETQIIYLMRNVPAKCTAKALCISLAEATDQMLGKKFYLEFLKDRLTQAHYVAQLRCIVATHFVGAIIIDEIQNLLLAKTEDKKELIALILNLRDEIGVPIILVGTYKAVDILKGDASITRRLVEGGFHELKRPKSSDDLEWATLCRVMWEYQWVKDPKPLSDEIIDVFYDCSQGVTGIMLNLFVQAQLEAIDRESEIIDAKLLREVYKERLSPLHNIIDALRSGNQELLNQYDDLYPKAFEKVNSFPNTIEMLKEQYMNQLEIQQGGLSKDSVKDVVEPTKKNPKMNENADTLLGLLTENSIVDEFLNLKDGKEF